MPDIEQERIEQVKAEQSAALQESIKRATDIEEMTRFAGWDWIKSYITNQIKDFANKAVVTGFTTMEELNYERGKVAGLRQLLSQIESDLVMLDNERNKKTA